VKDEDYNYWARRVCVALETISLWLTLIFIAQVWSCGALLAR
jgi:hypothetical protein